jgi:septal ring-binding cell division protein DamX
MLIINTMKKTSEFDPNGVKTEEQGTGGVFYIDKKADVEALATPALLEIFNAFAISNPDLGLREVNRFSTREVGINRVWGLYVAARAGTETKEAPAAKPKKKRAAEPKKKKTRKTAQGEGASPFRDKEVPKAAKVFEPRPGSKQAFMLELISPKEGIAVEDFIKKLNAEKRWSEYTTSNAWSSLVFNLHSNKGYGLICKDGRFYVKS